MTVILPPFNRSTGRVDDWARWWDVRVPQVLDRDIPPLPVGWHIRRPACPDGRHSFDAIEADANETYNEEAGTSSQRFRLVLTCTRCGLVERIEGVRDTSVSRARTGQVDPTPLRAGSLQAQQVSADAMTGGRKLDRYLVHDFGGAAVGVIDWACGRRGRAYYTGRLRDWPAGLHVEAPTPIGVLRKLARPTPPAPGTTTPRPVQEGTR